MVMIREEVPFASETLEELKESEEGKKKKVLLTEDLGVVKEIPLEGANARMDCDMEVDVDE